MKSIILFILTAATLVAEIVPAAQKPSSGWEGTVGIPGGIPTNYTLFANATHAPYNADPTGVADSTSGINAALAACGNGQYVYLPAGTYRCDGPIGRKGTYDNNFVQQHFSVMLKGDGPSLTRIISNATSGGDSIFFDAGGSPDGNWPINGGNSRGSTAIQVENFSPTTSAYLTLGKWGLVIRPNSTSGMQENDNNDYMDRSCSQYVRVTSIQDSGMPGPTRYTINFEPALNEAATGSTFSFPASVPYRCGIQDLYVEKTQSSPSANTISITGGQECWVKNIESFQAMLWHVMLSNSAGCEVRQAYVHDMFYNVEAAGGGNSDYGVGLIEYSCNNLIEDNIAVRTRHAFIIEYGGQGNVIAYNYSKIPMNENKYGTTYLMGDLIFHGGNARYNLYEGNVGATIRADTILGGSDMNTFFRNQIQRKGLPVSTVANFGSDIQWYSRSQYLVANVYERPPAAFGEGLRRWGTANDGIERFVAGATNANPIVVTTVSNVPLGGYGSAGKSPGWTTITGVLGNTAANVTNQLATASSSTTMVLTGIPGNGAYTSGGLAVSGIDTEAEGTSVVHGELNLIDNSITWDAGISDHTPPSSYYLTGKPAWWDNGRWPAVGPDLPTATLSPRGRGRAIKNVGGNPAYRRALAEGL